MGDRPGDKAGVHGVPGRGRGPSHEQGQGGGSGGATGGGNGSGRGFLRSEFSNQAIVKDTKDTKQPPEVSSTPVPAPRHNKTHNKNEKPHTTGVFVEQNKGIYENQSQHQSGGKQNQGGATSDSNPPRQAKPIVPGPSGIANPRTQPYQGAVFPPDMSGSGQSSHTPGAYGGQGASSDTSQSSETQRKIDQLTKKHKETIDELYKWIVNVSKALKTDASNKEDFGTYKAVIQQMRDECKEKQNNLQNIEKISAEINTLVAKMPSVHEELTTTTEIPLVQAITSYTAQRYRIGTGERLEVLKRLDKKWLLVKRDDSTQVTIHVSCVKTIPPRIIREVKVQAREAQWASDLRSELARSNIDISTAFHNIKEATDGRLKQLEHQRRILQFEQECHKFIAELQTVPLQKEDFINQRLQKLDMEAQHLMSNNLDRAGMVKELLFKAKESYDAVKSQQMRKPNFDPQRDPKYQTEDKEKKREEDVQKKRQQMVEHFKQFQNEAEEWIAATLKHIDRDDLGEDVDSTQAISRNTQHVLKEIEERIQGGFQNLVSTLESFRKEAESEVFNRGGDPNTLVPVYEVKATDDFVGSEFTVTKGEIMKLVDTKPSNPEFWVVQRDDGNKVCVPKENLIELPLRNEGQADLQRCTKMLEEVKQGLEDLSNKTKDKVKRLEERQKFHNFMQGYDKLNQLLDKSQGLETSGDRYKLKTDVNNLADDLQGSEYRDEVNQLRVDINLKCDGVKTKHSFGSAKDGQSGSGGYQQQQKEHIVTSTVDQQKLQMISNVYIQVEGKLHLMKTSDRFNLYTFYHVWMTENEYFVDKLNANGIRLVVGQLQGLHFEVTEGDFKDVHETMEYFVQTISSKILNVYDCTRINLDTKEALTLKSMLHSLKLYEDVTVLTDSLEKCYCIVGDKTDCNTIVQKVKTKMEDTPIKDGWRSSSYQVGTDRRQTLEFPDENYYSILQHCLSDRNLKRSVRLLGDHGIDVEIDNGACSFFYRSADGKDTKVLTNSITKIVVDRLAQGLAWCRFQRETDEQEKVLNYLTVSPAPDVKHGFVSIILYPTSICVIGKEDKCREFLKEVNTSLPIETELCIEKAKSENAVVTGHAVAAEKQDKSDDKKAVTEQSAKKYEKHSEGDYLRKLEIQGEGCITSEIECTKDEFKLLKDLKYEKYFNDSDLSRVVKLDLTLYPGKIQGHREPISKVENSIKKFISRVKTKIVFEKQESEALLLLDKEGLNEAAFQFIDNHLTSLTHRKPMDIDYSLRLTSSGQLKVSCRDESCCSRVAGLLSKCILTIKCNFEIKPLVDKEIENHKVLNCTNVFSMKDTCTYVCTSDVHQECMMMLEKVANMNSIELPDIWIDFLKDYGQGFLKSLSDVADGSAQVEDTGLKVKGNVQRCKEYLKKAFRCHQRSITLYMEEEDIEVCRREINELAQKFHFCWKIKASVKPSRELQNCSCIARWFDPYGSAQVTVITGILEDTDVDAMILITNQSLYPLAEPPEKCPPYFVKRGGTDFTQTVAKSHSLKAGTIYTYPRVPGDIKAKKVHCIVALEAVEHKKRLSHMDLESRLQTVLAQIYQTQLPRDKNQRQLSIGIHASNLQQYLNLEEVLGSVLRAYTNFCTAKPEAQLEICLGCFDGTVTKVTKIVNTYFKDQHGFGRVIYNEESFGIEKRKTSLKMEVERASILDSKVDVIVNTVDNSLDLNRGLVSKIILAKAGPEIQKECLSKKPKTGIPDGGYVITKSYKIQGKKAVIHGALAGYHKHTFQNHVKQFVKKCLYATEKLDGCRSIALPALGVGNLKYPRRDTACAMFDAVEEFHREALKPKLKQVKLVVYDEETSKIVCDEESRRSKKKGDLQEPAVRIVSRCLHKTAHSSTNVELPDVIVAVKEEVKRPSYAVEVFFNYSGCYIQPTLKPASQEPKSWNDRLTITPTNADRKGLQSAVHECLSYCDTYEERITEIIINTSKVIAMSEGEQVNLIADTICSLKKPSTYLRTAYIVVDKPAYENTKSTGKNWEEVSLAETGNVKQIVQLVGDESKLDEAERAVRHALQGNLKQTQKTGSSNQPSQPQLHHEDESSKPKSPAIPPRQTTQPSVPQRPPRPSNSSTQQDYEKQGAKPKTTTTAVGTVVQTGKPDHQPTPAEPTSRATDQDDDGFVDYDELFGSVSAVVNPGIVAFQKEIGGFDEWKTMIKTRFKLALGFTENEKDLQVEGSFRAISEFQEYLDKTFPSSTDSDTMHSDNDQQISDGGNEKHSNQMPTKKSYASSHVPHVDNVPDSKTDGSEPTAFTVNGITVKVLKGDITDLPVECIAISNQNHLCSPTGAAGHVAEAAGQAYKTECQNSAANFGNLAIGECRMTSAGKLKYKNVAHVFFHQQTWQAAKTTSRELLDALEEAVRNCFVMVNDAGLSTLAMTCIGAGTSKVGIDLCAQQYVRALQRFKKSSKLKEILFVDTKKNNVEAVHSMFSEHLDMIEDSADVGHWQLEYPTKVVRVDVIVQDISATVVDAAVSIEDEAFSGKGIHAQRLLKAGGDRYKNKHADMQKRVFRDQKKMESTLASEPLHCKRVIHVILPDIISRNGVKEMAMEVLKTVSIYGARTMAIPVMNHDSPIATEKLVVFEGMLSAFESFFAQNPGSSLRRIEVLCLHNAEMRDLNRTIQQRNDLWRRPHIVESQV